MFNRNITESQITNLFKSLYVMEEMSYLFKRVNRQNLMKWDGSKWNGMEWNGMECRMENGLKVYNKWKWECN